jgi:flagellar hook-basal body complex protein FliE
MPFPIAGLAPITPLPVSPLSPSGAGANDAGAFGGILKDAMQKVGSMSDEASKSVESFLGGEGEDLHKTMLATQRADLASELFLQVRNKVVAAYQEVMRMQV